MDLAEVYYSGIREQVKRVVGLLGEERTEAGMTAFVDGASSWASCFFARAVQPERLQDELDVARILGLRRDDGSLNLVPVRIVYRTFDGASSLITKRQLAEMIHELQAEYKAESAIPELPEVGTKAAKEWLNKASGQNLMAMLKKINFKDAEKQTLDFGGPHCA